LKKWEHGIVDMVLFQKFQFFILGLAQKYNQEGYMFTIINICNCIDEISLYEDVKSYMFLHQVDHILIDILLNEKIQKHSLIDSELDTNIIVRAIYNIMTNPNYLNTGFFFTFTCLKIFNDLFWIKVIFSNYY
jgi:hypothetical protein